MLNPSKWLLIGIFLTLVFGVVGLGTYTTRRFSLIEEKFNREIEEIRKEIKALKENIEQLKREISEKLGKTSPKEIDTSNWEIYRSEEYKFEIKYPKDWKKSCWTCEGFEITLTSPERERYVEELYKNPQDHPHAVMTVIPWDLRISCYQSVAEYVKEKCDLVTCGNIEEEYHRYQKLRDLLNDPKKRDNWFSEVKPIIFNGINCYEGVEYGVGKDVNKVSYSIFIEKDHNLCIINTASHTGPVDTLQDIIKQILQSFRFFK
jgi:hypothetical protein